jgi:hypothetical protein
MHRGLMVKTHHHECRKAVSPHSSCDCRQSPRIAAGCEPAAIFVGESTYFRAKGVPESAASGKSAVAKIFPRREYGLGSANF